MTYPAWNPVSTKPASPVAVLFFRGNLGNAWPDMGPASGEVRDERFDLGWWDGTSFRDNGSGSESMEPWSEPASWPTHWMVLPPIPSGA